MEKYLESSFTGQTNLKIYYQAWLPENPNKIVIVAHGLAEHGGRYHEVASQLLTLGCAVYAIDHRGHGKSEGDRAILDNYEFAIDDLNQLIDSLKITYPTLPFILLGHSMGGALSLGYAIKYQSKLSGLILSGPAVVLAGANPVTQILSRCLSVITPKLGLFPIDATLVSRDPKMVAGYDSDPLNHHGKICARTVGEIVRLAGFGLNNLSNISLPLLVMHGEADKLAAFSGGERIVKGAKSNDKIFKLYKNYFHEIFNEPLADRTVVFTDLKDWIKKHF